MAARSQWSNHALNVGAGGDFLLHAAETDENTFDFYVEADGRIDIRRSTNLFGDASFRDLHEGRGDPNTSTASEEPIDYSLTQARAGGFHRLNRLGFRLTGQLARCLEASLDDPETNSPARLP